MVSVVRGLWTPEGGFWTFDQQVGLTLPTRTDSASEISFCLIFVFKHSGGRSTPVHTVR